MAARLAVAGAAALAAALGALVWWDAQVRGGGAAAVPDLDAPARIAAGRAVYESHCAACHGARLEGQPDWQRRRPDGRLPAPPHDDSGHTWHHPFEVLFAITRDGLVPPYAPQGYRSDMPGFGDRLSDDEIWNALAFIRSRWSARARAAHDELQRQHAAGPHR